MSEMSAMLVAMLVAEFVDRQSYSELITIITLIINSIIIIRLGC